MIKILQKMVNYATSNFNIQLKLLQPLQRMQALMTNMMNTHQYNFQFPPDVQYKGGRRCGRGSGHFHSLGRFDYQNFTRSYHYYFCPHGACAHTSNRFRNNSKGHQGQATFESKFNGSNINSSTGIIFLPQRLHSSI